tara:strand:+ start:71033 stop:71917 length:885 start_codon:yes stop_codon:yes gene_type:complete
MNHLKLHHDRNSNEHTTRRGFAMAMVILLMIVVGLTIGVSMTRFSAQTKSVARQMEKYQEHHLGRGLQEAIGAWLKQQNGRNLLEVLEPETGHAMDIILADGSEVSVYLRDAQGTALSNLTGRTDRQIQEGGALLRNLIVNTTEREYLELTRPFGPSTISVMSAPDRVLDAAARVAAGQFADQFISEINKIRSESAVVTRTQLTRASQAAGLTAEQRGAVLRLFSADIELWAVIIEVRAGQGMNQGRLISRYGGITRIRINNRSNQSNASELGAFTTWKEIDIHTRDVDISQLY